MKQDITFISQREGDLPSIHSSSTDNFILIFPGAGIPFLFLDPWGIWWGWIHPEHRLWSTWPWPNQSAHHRWYKMGTWLHQTNQRNSQGFCENHWEKPFNFCQKFEVDGSHSSRLSTRRGELIWEWRLRRAKRWKEMNSGHIVWAQVIIKLVWGGFPPL